MEAGLSLEDGSVDVGDLVLFGRDGLVEMLGDDGFGLGGNFFFGCKEQVSKQRTEGFRMSPLLTRLFDEPRLGFFAQGLVTDMASHDGGGDGRTSQSGRQSHYPAK